MRRRRPHGCGRFLRRGIPAGCCSARPTRAHRAASSCPPGRGRAARAQPALRRRVHSQGGAGPAAAAQRIRQGCRDHAASDAATANASAGDCSAAFGTTTCACCNCSAWVVSVPVLSMNSRSTRASASSASSRCTSTPRRARPPAAASSAAGAASDSAQGQVTISTDTATQTARDGSITLHAAAAAAASASTAHRKGPAQRSASARQRRPLAHRVAHQGDDGLVACVGADPLRPASSPARPGSGCRPPRRRRAPWAPASIRR